LDSDYSKEGSCRKKIWLNHHQLADIKTIINPDIFEKVRDSLQIEEQIGPNYEQALFQVRIQD